MAKTKVMTKAEGLQALHQLVPRLNAALEAVEHPARFVLVVSPDKSDPLNNLVVVGMKAGHNLVHGT